MGLETIILMRSLSDSKEWVLLDMNFSLDLECEYCNVIHENLFNGGVLVCKNCKEIIERREMLIESEIEFNKQGSIYEKS